jgi:hypothetical protein
VLAATAARHGHAHTASTTTTGGAVGCYSSCAFVWYGAWQLADTNSHPHRGVRSTVGARMQ